MHTLPITRRKLHRHYEPPGPVPIRSERVAVRDGGVTLVVWVPKSGIGDPGAFVATVERRWRTLAGGIDAIIESAMPIIEASVEDFWGPGDERPPLAATILDDGKLFQINMNAGDGEHVVLINDAGDHIGCHDLLITLDNAFVPEYAHFDG
ncbi:MAG: hypothetical protein ACIAS6_00605 [Phycisphaerales bacterium JB060]